MALKREFVRELDDLWKRRTSKVLSLVDARKDRRKGLNRRSRDRGIQRLQDLATQILLKQSVRQELDAITSFKIRRYIKGHGIDQRFDRIIRWARQKSHDPIIYAFWRGRKCLYVGKGRNWKRLLGYRDKVYIKEATSITIRGIRSPSYIAKAECLMMHKCDPRRNRVRAAHGKHKKKCPICFARRNIKEELRTLFRM